MANINEQILNLQREPLVVGAGGAVNSVNGQTGDVVLTAEDVGALPDSTVIPTQTSELENDSDYQTGDEVNQAIGLEITARENADNNLQSQIDAITASSDVTDIVGTYAQLQAYDTSTLGDNDIIKVLQDEEHNNETTYYRWSTSTQTFTLIGEEGPYYTKSAADSKFQDKLTPGSNITIDANNEISATDTTYSDFTGTDGTSAGTAGLVPAPATTDAGKYLKADGTWDSVSGGIPTNATFWGASYDSANNKVDGEMFITPASTLTTLGANQLVIGRMTNALNSSYIYSNANGLYLGPGRNNKKIIFGNGSLANEFGEISQSEWNVKSHRITNLSTPINGTDAANKNYTDNLVINYSALNGASAPTTTTEAKYIGQLYYDTTNEQLYFLKEIDTTTTPATYTWEAVGGGSSVNVVQATGTSTTDVMSQAAATNMIYPSGQETSHNNIIIGEDGTPTPSGNTGVIAIGPGRSGQLQGNQQAVRIGYGTRAMINAVAIGYGADGGNDGQRNVVIGNNAFANNADNTVLGAYANTASNIRSVALGRSSTTTRDNEVSVGSGTTGNYNTRFIANVTDPTLAHDAATKNYVDSIYPVGAVFTSTSATAPTIAGGTWTEIGTQTIGSSTVHYYERTA